MHDGRPGRAFPSRTTVMDGVLGTVYRCIATNSIQEAGFSGKADRVGAVTQ